MSFNEILNDRGGLVKMWNYGVQIDENTRQQALDLVRLPFIYRNVSLMPDAHLGKGATIGSVVPTIGAVIPATVGVDIGCGMIAQKLNVKREALSKSLTGIHSAVTNVGEWQQPACLVDDA